MALGITTLINITIKYVSFKVNKFMCKSALVLAE
jgi:hypothetical protein